MGKDGLYAILGRLILTWYFYERSPLMTNGYHCWQISSFKPLLSKFELNSFISYSVWKQLMSDFFAKIEKSDFVCLLNTIFCVEKPYQKPALSSINIIWTLLCRMGWFRSGLPNFFVVLRAQKPYQVQVVQMRSLDHKWSIKSMIIFWMTRKWRCVR